MRPNFIRAKDSEMELSELMVPSNSNFSGKIHGGFVLSLMDKIAFSCASKFSGLYTVTASVDKVDFLSPVEVGDLLILKSKIVYTGRSSMVVGIRVNSMNIRSGEVKHCNSSYFTMVARENGKSAKVPGLILENSNDIRRFLETLERKTRNKRYQNIFDDMNIDFTSGHFLKIIEGENMKLDLK
ncbi:MAG: acyl-CoA thioesterase [Flavobacteriales bacterium]|nr:acyl-CoA thioesterase [Flavobacteriales bacterium]